MSRRSSRTDTTTHANPLPSDELSPPVPETAADLIASQLSSTESLTTALASRTGDLGLDPVEAAKLQDPNDPANAVSVPMERSPLLPTPGSEVLGITPKPLNVQVIISGAPKPPPKDVGGPIDMRTRLDVGPSFPQYVGPKVTEAKSGGPREFPATYRGKEATVWEVLARDRVPVSVDGIQTHLMPHQRVSLQSHGKHNVASFSAQGVHLKAVG